jgi:hypothetical protein
MLQEKYCCIYKKQFGLEKSRAKFLKINKFGEIGFMDFLILKIIDIYL